MPPTGSSPSARAAPGRTELRRRLYRLSAQVFFHPHWQQGRPCPAQWRRLRELTDTGERLGR
ncbi:hypothetical protein ABK046_01970 [Streptomyces caeruleatus]